MKNAAFESFKKDFEKDYDPESETDRLLMKELNELERNPEEDTDKIINKYAQIRANKFENYGTRTEDY